MNDEVWNVIRNTPGITGFVGSANKPTPLPRKEVESFLGTAGEADGQVVKQPSHEWVMNKGKLYE